MVASQIKAIDTTLNDIRELAIEKIGAQEAFSHLLLPTPSHSVAEITFLRFISWLYCAYYESAKTLFKALSNENNHYINVNLLRTHFQHGFDTLNSKRDQELSQKVVLWFSTACSMEGEPKPCDEAKWKDCLSVILIESSNFLERCKSDLESMNEPGLGRLRYRISLSVPAHQLESILKEVLSDFGLLDFIDSSKLTKSYTEKINHELREKNPPDLNNFIRRIFEKYIANEMPLPIDGKDIIKIYGQSPKVRECLEFARDSMISKPCGKDELLSRIEAVSKKIFF